MPFDLEREALIASGVKENDLIDTYRDRLDCLCREFMRQVSFPNDVSSRPKALFTWLWQQKPDRYKAGSCFILNDVIDSQMDQETTRVGNCLGLTLLYNCLLKRMGISAGALNLENAFGTGPHVLTVLETEKTLIEVENIFSHGFDYSGHTDNPSRTIWGDKELVADIYLTSGNLLFDKGNFHGAIEKYDLAIDLNSQYEKAHINRAICLMRLENKEGV